jgi:hypothetical protein
LPVGDYFLAEFVENKPGEDVTLLGCFEFCTVRGIPFSSTFLPTVC